MKLNQLTPNLMVNDVAKTIEQYRSVFGFEVLMAMPQEGQPEWAMIKNGGVLLMLQSRASIVGEYPALAARTLGGSQTFYIEVEDVHGWHERVGKLIKIVKPLHETFYGKREFCCEDCNGYLLTFSENVK
jgi:uncharacterized glyoxalase superfamily protein PhnB